MLISRYVHLLSAVVCAGIAGQLAAHTIPAEGFAARVNDQVIMVTDVLAVMQPMERQLRQTYQGADLDQKLQETYDRALDSLVERELILNYFRQQQGMTLSDKIVNSRMDELIRNKFANSRAAFKKALDSEGMTVDEWRENLKNSMIVNFLRDREVESRVTVSPQAVRDAYEKNTDTFRTPEQVRLWMIVLHDGQTEEEKTAKHKQAEDLRKRLLAGESFAELAVQVSEGIYAKHGGDCGWIDPASRRAELGQAIRNLEIDAISPVIQAGDDLYILKITERKEAAAIAFEQVRDTLRAELEKQEARRLYEDWIARLKKDALIQKY